jgi:hypothetical protein
MAPEQASGKIDEVGKLADVYSLGAILYCLLTGRPPFQAANPMDTLLQVLDKEPIALRELNASIPRDLETIAMKCLEKDPQQRYESSKLLANDLERFLSDEPILAKPLSLAGHVWRRARKHRRFLNSIFATVAASISLTIVGWAIWDFYHRQQLSLLTVGTEGYPLTAELLHETEDRVLQSFTVPTETPVEVAAGQYRIRATGPGLLGQTFHVSLNRGSERKFDIDLAKQRLWKPIGLEPSEEYELINFTGQMDIILLERRFGRTALRRLDGATRRSVWESPIGRSLPESTDENERRWKQLTTPWADSVLSDNSFPILLKPAADLDGDGQHDLVYYWPKRDDIPTVALSGATGKLLWQRSWEGKQRIAAPISTADVENDGGQDLIVAAYRLEAEGIRIEALSGKDGKTLWQRELSELKPAADTTGGIWSSQATDRWKYEYRFGCDAQVLETEDGPVVSFHHGRYVAGVKLSNGELAWKTIDIRFEPAAHPQLIDTNGDGTIDSLAALSSSNSASMRDLSVVSLDDGALLWSKLVNLVISGDLRNDWINRRLPCLVDLNKDNKPEIVLPSPVATSQGLEVSVIDAHSGETRWEHVISPTARTNFRLLLQVPDIDGDGVDDLAITSRSTLYSDGFNSVGLGDSERLFVDVLSGTNGASISVAQPTIRFAGLQTAESLELGPNGIDGLPELVFTIESDSVSKLKEAFFISAATGVITRKLASSHAICFADFNGDGLRDVFVERRTNESKQLNVVAGQPPEPWRRLGNLKPAEDYDRDGLIDMVAISGDKEKLLQMISGNDGRVIWQTAVKWSDVRAHVPQTFGSNGSTFMDPGLIPLKLPLGDLDRDGTADLLISARSSWGPKTVSGPFPLMAISGATGRKLWDSPIWQRPPHTLGNHVWSGWHIDSLESVCADLHGDGIPKIVCLHHLTWVDQHQGIFTSNAQLCLTVTNGYDGSIIWTTPIGPSATLEMISKDHLPVVMSRDIQDLNGDGVADLVVTVPEYQHNGKSDGIGTELWAVSGQDGLVLWKHPLKHVKYPKEHQGKFTDQYQIASAKVVDLDADDRPEVIIADVDASNDLGGPVFSVVVLEGNDGSVRWEWGWNDKVGSEIYLPEVVIANLDGDGRHSVGVRFNDPVVDSSKDTLLFFDSDGQERWRKQVGPALFGNGRFENGQQKKKVVPVDLTLDGRHEVVLATTHYVKAINGVGESMWDENLGSGSAWIDNVIFGEDSPTIIVGNNNAYFGLSGLTGKRLWAGKGLSANQSKSVTENWCLPAEGPELPRILSVSGDQAVTRICQSVEPNEDVNTSNSLSRLSRFNRMKDPRLARPLPWVEPKPIFRFTFSQSVLSLVLLPGWLLLRALRRWRLSVRGLLLAPMFVAIWMSAVYAFCRLITLPGYDIPISTIAVTGLRGLIALPFVWLSLVWLIKRRWWRLAALVATAVISAFTVGTIVYSDSVQKLQPLEYYVWTWNTSMTVLIWGMLVAGWLAMAVVISISAIGYVRKRLVNGHEIADPAASV